MKKKLFAVFTAGLVALQCFAGLPNGNISAAPLIASAEFEDAVSADEAGMQYDVRVLINGYPITENTTVRDGDILLMDFNWKLPTNFTYVNGTFAIDLNEKLYGISLGNDEIPVSDTALYTVSDDMLYVQLLTGSSGRSGGCYLEGVIDLSGVPEAETGSFNLKYFDTIIPVRVPNQTPGLWVDKFRDGTVYADISGDYYQDFKINVTSYGKDSETVTVTDVFGSDVYESYSDVQLNGSPITPVATTVDGKAGFSLDLGSMAVGTTNTITYTVKLDKDRVLSGTLTDADLKNSVTAISGTDSTNASTDADSYWVDYPSVDKTGVYDSATGKITWTITVKPNALFENSSFTVTDVPDAAITQAVKDVLGDSLTVPVAYDSVLGAYTYTYTIDAPAANVTDTTISNKAVASFPAENITSNDSASVIIPGTYKNFTDKSVSGPADGKLNWTVDVKLPQSENVSQVQIFDQLYKGDYEGSQEYLGADKPVHYDYSTLDVDVYLDGVLQSDYNIVKNSDNTYLAKVDGAGEITDVIGQLNKYNSDAEKFTFIIEDRTGSSNYPVEKTDGSWAIVNSSFLQDNRDKQIDIKVKISSTYDSDVLRCSNTAVGTVIIDGVGAADDAYAEYEKDYDGIKTAADASKNYFGNNYHNDLRNALGWQIKVTAADWEAGDIITVTDTLPAGYEYVPSSALLFFHNNADIWDTEPNQSKLTADTSVAGKVTFSLTIDQDIIDRMAVFGAHSVKINYLTEMTEAEEDALIFGTVSKEYKNSASITLYDKDKDESVALGTSVATHVVEPDLAQIIDKTIDDENGVQIGSKFYADYTVTINAADLQLFGGNSFTATDKLGENLTLEGEPVISPKLSGETSYYNTATNTITFSGLSDSTTYTIKYRVKVEQIPKDSTPEKPIEQLFGNEISVDVAGTTTVGDNIVLAEGLYESEGSYNFDEDRGTITISGTKTWTADGKHLGARPAYITIKIKCIATAADSTQTESVIEKVIPAQPIDSDGNWSYTTGELVTLDNSGTSYKYTVTEVLVDGYAVSYTANGSAGGNENITNSLETDATYALDITNTFTAATEEIGAVTVTKQWMNDTVADRPDEIIFVLSDTEGNVYEKTLSKNDTSVTFSNLPLYVYSRNATTNALERELRTYSLEEKCDAAYSDKWTKYSASYSKATFTLSDVELSPGAALGAPAQVTVTNTRASVSPIVLYKTYEGAEASALAALAAGTKFSLYTDAACATTPVETLAPTVNGSDVAVKFSTGLDFGNTYYIKETTAPAGYKLSTTVYECKVDNSGSVTYKIYGSADAYSAVAPSCENAKTGTPVGGDSTDNPSTDPSDPPSGGTGGTGGGSTDDPTDDPSNPPIGGDSTDNPSTDPSDPPSGGTGGTGGGSTDDPTDDPSNPPIGGDSTDNPSTDPSDPPSGGTGGTGGGSTDDPSNPPIGGDSTDNPSTDPSDPPSGGTGGTGGGSTDDPSNGDSTDNPSTDPSDPPSGGTGGSGGGSTDDPSNPPIGGDSTDNPSTDPSDPPSGGTGGSGGGSTDDPTDDPDGKPSGGSGGTSDDTDDYPDSVPEGGSDSGVQDGNPDTNVFSFGGIAVLAATSFTTTVLSRKKRRNK